MPVTRLMKALQGHLSGCGIPCARGDTAPVGSLPCLTWTAALTAPEEGSVTLTCWYRRDDTALLTMLDRLGELFPASGILLWDEANQPLWLWPTGVSCLRDGNDPGLRGGRMTLALRLWPGMEVRG